MSYSRIAIVNRGEPAMRLIDAVRECRAERDLDLATIALFTEPDRHCSFVSEADEPYALGPARIRDHDLGEVSAYAHHPTLRAVSTPRAETVPWSCSPTCRASTVPRNRCAASSWNTEQSGIQRAELLAEADRVREEVYAEHLHRLAGEFDTVHSVEWARRVGSVHRIVQPSALRPYLIDAVERGMGRTLATQRT